jgi:hypothetical protein
MYLNQGVKTGILAYKISEETGMSYRWVMKYLSDHLKERPGLGDPSRVLELDLGKIKVDKSKVAHHATIDFERLVSDLPKKVICIRNYRNTNFVSLILERRFYEKFEKIASSLGVAPETILNNALNLILEQFEFVRFDSFAAETNQRARCRTDETGHVGESAW